MRTSTNVAAVDVDELRRLVARHRVSFATRPIRRVADGGELAAVGFEIELLGVHDAPSHPPEPGCEECVLVYEHMRSIAEAVLPQERESSLEVRAYEPRFVFDRVHRGLPAVVLTIEILHRTAYDRPVDVCEERCKDDICRALRALGVSGG